jgi:hypothetical protein
MAEQQRKMIEARQLIDAAMTSGQVRVWRSDVVYKADDFVYHSGTEPKIEHRPVVFGDRGPFLGAYSIVELANGEQSFEFMRAEDVNKAKGASRSTGANSPWVMWFDEMAKKACIKRHAKRFSHIPALAALIDKDNEEYTIGDPPPGYTPAKATTKAPPAQTKPPVTPRSAMYAELLARVGGDEAIASKAIGIIESIGGEIDERAQKAWWAQWTANPPPRCPICAGRLKYQTITDQEITQHNVKYGARNTYKDENWTPCGICEQTGEFPPKGKAPLELAAEQRAATLDELVESYELCDSSEMFDVLEKERAIAWKVLNKAEKATLKAKVEDARKRIATTEQDKRAEETLDAMGNVDA